MEEDIHRAAESIPTLIAQEQLHEPEAVRASKRRFLWIGVGGTMIVIVAMWYWNASSMIKKLKNAQGAEPALFQNAAEDFRTILDRAALQNNALRQIEAANYASKTDLEQRIAQALEEEFQAAPAQSETTTTSL